MQLKNLKSLRWIISSLMVGSFFGGVADSIAQQPAVKFGGIGVRIDRQDGATNLILTEVLIGGAAQKAGLLKGDVILAVNSVQTEGKSLKEVSQTMRGEIGSTLTVVYRRDGGPIQKVFLQRQILETPAVTNSIQTPLLTDDKIANLKIKAEAGDAHSQYILGIFYKKIDIKEAVRWYLKAAQQDEPHAQFDLGGLYEDGEGLDKDLAEAARWYRKAANQFRKTADQGDSDAQYLLGLCYKYGKGVEKDYVETTRWLRKAADQDNSDAQYLLGCCYDLGQGVDKNQSEAARWYRKAAEQGYAIAQHSLGGRYSRGQGVEKNLVEAVHWYRKAADQGDAGAQYDLGLSYMSGRGVGKDPTEGMRWFRKAAEQGDADAQDSLGTGYCFGEGVEKNMAEAMRWYSKAADQGVAPAQYNLGLAYAKGKGVEKDLAYAWAYCSLAAQNNQEDAPKTVKIIEEDISVEQLARGRQILETLRAKK